MERVLVDVYNGFGGVAGQYHRPDRIASRMCRGHEKIAQIFFDAIKTRLEIQR